MATSPQLRPMSIGDMFDAAFRLYRQYFLTFVGIVALLQVPMAILQFLLQLTVSNRALQNWVRFTSRPTAIAPGQNPLAAFPVNDLLTIVGIGLLTATIQFLFARNLITGALANAVDRVYRGQSISIVEAYSFGVRRFLALLGASLATFVIGAAVTAVIIGCSFGSIFALSSGGSRSSGLAAAIAIILLMFGLFVLLGLLALYVYTRLMVTTQAIVLEDRGPLAGLGRSWRLVGGSFWRSLGVLVLMGILTYIIAQFPATIASFALTLASRNSLDSLPTNQLITALLAQIGQIVVLPLQLLIYTLLYYDLRIRKEGYDLELMAQQAAAT